MDFHDLASVYIFIQAVFCAKVIQRQCPQESSAGIASDDSYGIVGADTKNTCLWSASLQAQIPTQP